MKLLIYFSGITGFILLVLSLIGIFHPALESNVFFFTGAAFLLICFTLLFRLRYLQDRKADEIIRSYKEKDRKPVVEEDKKAGTRGWSMNNSPFRERRSGLSWGGGNIHAANANRGRRRSFLR